MKTQLFAIIILQVVGGLTLVPWFMTAGISFMTFETRRSIRKIVPWLVVGGVFSYPFIIGGCFYQAWSTLEEGRDIDPMFWSILPTLVFLVVYFFVTHITDFYQELSRKR